MPAAPNIASEPASIAKEEEEEDEDADCLAGFVSNFLSFFFLDL